MTSTQGRGCGPSSRESRVEIRKVVWPTRQETTQTAIAVFVFTLIMALFFWALDSGLLWLTRRSWSGRQPDWKVGEIRQWR